MRKTLYDYFWAVKLIERKEEELAWWQERARRCTSIPDKIVVCGGSPFGLAEIVAKVDEIEGQINLALCKLLEIKETVEETIAGVDDSKLRLLLELRYIKGLRWGLVADRMGYSYDWVLAMHGRALRKIPKKVKKTD